MFTYAPSPLMHKRHLFSQVDHFALYEVLAGDGSIVDDVFAFSNMAEGPERSCNELKAKADAITQVDRAHFAAMSGDWSDGG